MRWLIFACLLGFSFLGYLHRTAISIVGEDNPKGITSIMAGRLVVNVLAGSCESLRAKL